MIIFGLHIFAINQEDMVITRKLKQRTEMQGSLEYLFVRYF